MGMKPIPAGIRGMVIIDRSTQLIRYISAV